MYTLLSVLLALWLVGLVAHIGGSFIHLLLVVAGIMLIVQLMTNRSTI